MNDQQFSNNELIIEFNHLRIPFQYNILKKTKQ